MQGECIVSVHDAVDLPLLSSQAEEGGGSGICNISVLIPAIGDILPPGVRMPDEMGMASLSLKFLSYSCQHDVDWSPDFALSLGVSVGKQLAAFAYLGTHVPLPMANSHFHHTSTSQCGGSVGCPVTFRVLHRLRALAKATFS